MDDDRIFMTDLWLKDFIKDVPRYLKIALDEEPVQVTTEDNRDVIIIPMEEYNALRRAKNNLEYLEKLRESKEQLRNGQVIVKTMAELEAMARE